jgi:hypothetical protein
LRLALGVVGGERRQEDLAMVMGLTAMGCGPPRVLSAQNDSLIASYNLKDKKISTE